MFARVARLVVIGGVLIAIAFAVRMGALTKQRGPRSLPLRVISWLERPRGDGITDQWQVSRPGLVWGPRW